MTESKPKPNWFIPTILALLLAGAGAAAFCGWSLLGDPSADFLMTAAVVEAGLLAWAYFDKGLTGNVRGAVLAVLIAAPLVGMAFTDIGPVQAFRELFRKQRGPTPYEPPPPTPFDYEYPKSDVVPDLSTVGKRDWPGFRGADCSGRAASPVRLAADWKKNPPKLLWTHPVGGGVSCPVVVGDVLVSHEQRGADEVVACYELRTGKQCWEHREDQYFHESYCGPGPRATPIAAKGSVISLGGLGRLLCLDATGETKWKVDLVAKHKAQPPGFGIIASPLVVDDAVVVGIGGEKAGLVAYAVNDGSLRWTSEKAQASYSSPMLTTLAGVRQIIWYRHGGLMGCDPKTGRTLWTQEWKEGIGNNICQPLVFSSTGAGELDAAFISTSDGGGCAAFAVDANFQVRELWRNKNLKLKYSSALQIGGAAVGLDERLLAAIDLKTGKRLWKHGERFGYGQVIASGDHLLIQSEDGAVVLGAANEKEFKELGEFQTVLKRTWNSPALAGDLLVVRNHEAMAVYRLAVE